MLPVLKVYKDNINNLSFLAAERNRILIHKHGNIPNYVLWDAESMQNETDDDLMKWFAEMLPAIIKMKQFYSEFSQRFIGPCCKEP